MSDLLEIKGIAKSFGGVKALTGVSFGVERGSISAIIGPNGSGKTTLINVITGFYQPDAGQVCFNGISIHGLQPHAIARLGIARTFQNLRQFDTMIVEDTVKVPLHWRLREPLWRVMIGSRAFKRTERDARDRARMILERLSLSDIEGRRVSSLPYGQRRMVEIARALSLSPQLLLLDEPVAGMNPHESLDLMEKVRGLAREGMTIILIEHDMQVVMKYSDVITVLNHGQVIARGPACDIQNNRDVVEAYLGKSRVTQTAKGST